MLAPSILLRFPDWLGVLALLSLHPTLLLAQSSPKARPAPACGCPDGRRFAVGAAMFGKNSARVMITGFRPEASASTGIGEPQCRDLMVLGQIVRLWKPLDDRPFLKRENLKRGTVPNICDTKIHFIETRKNYDFFAGNGIAVTLTDEDDGQPAISREPESDLSVSPAPEIEYSEDLTGRDLLRLMVPQRFGGSSMEPLADPGDSAFDEQDLKEGAYFMLRTSVKAPLIGDRDTDTAAMADTTLKSPQPELSVFAGTLGRIEHRAGFRSEPLWIVEVLPGSSPGPFWRSLLSLPRGFGEHHALPRKVILASNQMVEINHFFDQYGVEWTRFGEEASAKIAASEDPGTTRLPEIYAPPVLPLEENVAAAERARVVEAIKQEALGLILIFRNSETLSRRETLVLEELTRSGSRAAIAPDLLHRQCFIGLDRLEKSPAKVTGYSASPAFLVTGVDVKVFRPKSSARVPPSYYAIDLELLLSPNFSSAAVPLVCRFPSVPIDTAIVGMAERILSSGVEIQRGKGR
ncbi:MAG: hypothetical protein JWO19_4334 [Bryobacterales bacterium]|nr:hypothetical protein [Bryobacterales bacterium]